MRRFHEERLLSVDAIPVVALLVLWPDSEIPEFSSLRTGQRRHGEVCLQASHRVAQSKPAHHLRDAARVPQPRDEFPPAVFRPTAADGFSSAAFAYAHKRAESASM